MDTDYLLPEEKDKEKINTLFKYYPEENPIMIAEDVQEENMPSYMKTPMVNMNTPMHKDQSDTATP